MCNTKKDVKKDIMSIFKEGYVFKVEVYDFDSPEIQKLIADTHKAQQECLDRKKLDYESLQRRMTI